MLSQLTLFSDYSKPTIKFPSTRYQGSKYKFVGWIWQCLKDLEFHSALDAFGGTGSIAFLLKENGKKVTYNDILPFNHIIGKALIENSDTVLNDYEVETLLREYSHIDYPNFIEKTFKDIYFTDEENHWLDIISTNIRHIKNPYKQAIAYFALFQSCIIKRPYNLFHRKNLYVRLQEVERSFGNKKTWDTPFAVHFKKFVLEANRAIFNNGEICSSINKNIFEVENNYDLVYIDTPYINENGIGVDYADFYHFLNGIVGYDNWKYNIDYKSNHLRLVRQPNVWCNSLSIYPAFEELFYKFRNSILAISYRNNGIPKINELVAMLKNSGKEVKIYTSDNIKYALSSKLTNEVLIVAE
ncbi:MAG: DNA adenine methylase [Bacteroidales bacterium]|nr:DNA adenine methylase [Bacteroidales bacterium]